MSSINIELKKSIMRKKGSFVLLSLSLVILGIYFAVFGFSHHSPTKYGQIAALICIGFYAIDDYFRD